MKELGHWFLSFVFFLVGGFRESENNFSDG